MSSRNLSNELQSLSDNNNNHTDSTAEYIIKVVNPIKDINKEADDITHRGPTTDLILAFYGFKPVIS